MSILAGLAAHSSRRQTLRRGAAVIVLVALLAGWWALLRPSLLGGPVTLVTVTGVSMQPRFHTGDLAVVYERDSYQVGEVIAFRAEAVPDQPGAHVLHRIVGGDPSTGYVTRGDNNDWDDPWRPTAETVSGELVFSVPGVGSAVRWLSQPTHLAAIFGGVMASLVMFGGKPTAARRTDDQSADRTEAVTK